MKEDFAIHIPSLLTTQPDKLKEYLQEDLGYGDISSNVILKEKTATAEIFVKEDCILAGLEEAASLFGLLSVGVKPLFSDGASIEEGKRVLLIKGDVRSIGTNSAEHYFTDERDCHPYP